MPYLLLVLLISLTACLKDETISGQIDPEDIWILSELNMTAVAPTITIQFPGEGQIAGSGPCNRYFAEQKAPLPWFEIGPIGSTKMACPEMTLEATYFEMLSKMNTAERTNDSLLLTAESGETLLYHKD